MVTVFNFVRNCQTAFQTGRHVTPYYIPNSMYERSDFFVSLSVLFFFFNFVYVFLAVLGLCCCMWAFSNCSKQGPLSGCGVRASHCSGFSWCRAQAPECEGFSSCSSQALERRLSSRGTQAELLHGMGSHPGPGIELVSPGRQIINHCTNREVSST